MGKGKIKAAENPKEDTVLFHQKGQTEKEAGKENGATRTGQRGTADNRGNRGIKTGQKRAFEKPLFSLFAPVEFRVEGLIQRVFAGAKEEECSGERGKDDKMGCVTGQAKDGLAGGKKSVTDCCDNAGRFVENFSANQKEQEDGCGIDEGDTDVNGGIGLTEYSHDEGVGGVSSGQLHVVGLFERRHALKNELAGVGVFAFVTFERHLAQANANGQNEQNRQTDNEPGAVAEEELPQRTHLTTDELR